MTDFVDLHTDGPDSVAVMCEVAASFTVSAVLCVCVCGCVRERERGRERGGRGMGVLECSAHMYSCLSKCALGDK